MISEAKIIEDSISEEGVRITTMQVKFHRFILPEFNTHRAFSRNFSSSRAIPITKLIEQVRTNPAMPVYWGKNKPGMQATEELIGIERDIAIANWELLAEQAANDAEMLSNLGVHKQLANRLLENWVWATGIVTSTEWDNFYQLRIHPDAQPEIQALARVMKTAQDNSQPRPLKMGEWHLPYITDAERNDNFFKNDSNKKLLQKISAARCCRVSYLKQDGEIPNIEDDLALYNRLAGSEPLHASPLEHQATPDIMVNSSWGNPKLHGNFVGWNQFRRYVQFGID